MSVSDLLVFGKREGTFYLAFDFRIDYSRYSVESKENDTHVK